MLATLPTQPVRRSFLTLAEVAGLYGVTQMTIRNWMSARKIRYLQVGHVIRFYPDNTKASLVENTVIERTEKREDVERSLEREIDTILKVQENLAAVGDEVCALRSALRNEINELKVERAKTAKALVKARALVRKAQALLAEPMAA